MFVRQPPRHVFRLPYFTRLIFFSGPRERGNLICKNQYFHPFGYDPYSKIVSISNGHSGNMTTTLPDIISIRIFVLWNLLATFEDHPKSILLIDFIFRNQSSLSSFLKFLFTPISSKYILVANTHDSRMALKSVPGWDEEYSEVENCVSRVLLSRRFCYVFNHFKTSLR